MTEVDFIMLHEENKSKFIGKLLEYQIQCMMRMEIVNIYEPFRDNKREFFSCGIVYCINFYLAMP